MVNQFAKVAEEATKVPIGNGCVWRARLDPVVRATEMGWAKLKSNPALFINEDLPGVLYDAAEQYQIMRMNADAYFAKLRSDKAKAEAERRAQQQSRSIVR